MRPDHMPPVAGIEPVETTTHHLSYSAPQQRSPWHSPVPYLFGGLAAMLGLIAFALLLLACSYWKLSGYLENAGATGHGDLESGEGKPGDANAGRPSVYPPEQRIVVIMAGETNPTYLATPKSNNNNNNNNDRTTSAWGEDNGNDAEAEEKAVAEMEPGGGSESSQYHAAHQLQEEVGAERGDGETHRIVDGDLRQ